MRVKAYGSLGDKGCDGYLQSTGAVYACYGAQNGAAGSVASFISKMNADFAKAKADIPQIMKSWYMTHNIVEGLPVEAITAKSDLETENPDLEFFFLGRPRMLEIFGAMTEEQRIAFLGAHARNEDYLTLQIGEVKELVDSIMLAVEGSTPSTAAIAPVSPQKLEFNAIPATWIAVIRGGRLNAHHVAEYFGNHFDPLRGESTAKIFRDKYLELKAQALGPGTIMFELYQFVVGPDSVDIDRQVAAHSLLAYLFERCDIFENLPSVEVAE